MSNFENTAEEFPALGGKKSPEQLAEMRREREEADADKAAFLAEQKRIREKEQSDAAKESRARSAEILEREVIEIVMQENPNFSWHEAKSLYDHQLKELIAIERFKSAFFGTPTGAKGLLGVSRM